MRLYWEIWDRPCTWKITNRIVLIWLLYLANNINDIVLRWPQNSENNISDIVLRLPMYMYLEKNMTRWFLYVEDNTDNIHWDGPSSQIIPCFCLISRMDWQLGSSDPCMLRQLWFDGLALRRIWRSDYLNLTLYHLYRSQLFISFANFLLLFILFLVCD